MHKTSYFNAEEKEGFKRAAEDEGRAQMEAGCSRSDAVIAVTGDDAKNLVICQLAKVKCGAPRVIARVNNPKNEIVFKTLGIDETISSTRVLMGVIEQELPSGGFMPLMPLAGSANAINLWLGRGGTVEEKCRRQLNESLVG